MQTAAKWTDILLQFPTQESTSIYGMIQKGE